MSDLFVSKHQIQHEKIVASCVRPYTTRELSDKHRLNFKTVAGILSRLVKKGRLHKIVNRHPRGFLFFSYVLPDLADNFEQPEPFNDKPQSNAMQSLPAHDPFGLCAKSHSK